jgi:hypothetical protein
VGCRRIRSGAQCVPIRAWAQGTGELSRKLPGIIKATYSQPCYARKLLQASGRPRVR